MTHQDNYDFTEGNGCAFVNKMYVDTATQQNGVSCFAKNVSVSGDFLFQVKMTILTGTSGGLIFGAKSTNTNSNGYIVSLDTSLYYSFYHDGPINCNAVPIDANHQSCLSPSGQPGLNETNEIAILVQGHTASLFINGKFVDKIYINISNDAYIGFFSNYSSTGNEVAFSDAELWNL